MNRSEYNPNLNELMDIALPTKESKPLSQNKRMTLSVSIKSSGKAAVLHI